MSRYKYFHGKIIVKRGEIFRFEPEPRDSNSALDPVSLKNCLKEKYFPTIESLKVGFQST